MMKEMKHLLIVKIILSINERKTTIELLVAENECESKGQRLVIACWRMGMKMVKTEIITIKRN